MTGRGIFRDKTGRTKYAICIESFLFGWNWFVRVYSSSCAEQGGLSACVMGNVNKRSVMKKYLLGLAGLVFVPFITLFSGCGGSGVNPGFVPLANTPRFAYVVNSGDNTVSQYTVNASTGLLRANGYALTGAAPKAIAFAPNGKFAYVVNSGDTTVRTYVINANTGVLTFASSVFAGSTPVAIAISPSGKFAFVANSASNDVSAYVIDQSTGALSNVGATVSGLGQNATAAAGTTPSAIMVDHSGKYVYVTNSGAGLDGNSVSAYKINLQTGGLDRIDRDATTPTIDNFTAGANPTAIATDPTGRFVYVTNNGAATVTAYSIDAATGALIIAGTASSVGTGLSSVAVSPSGEFAYVANSSTNNVSVYSILPTTGALTHISVSAAVTGTTPVSVSIDPSGQFAYVANQGTNDVSVYSINATNGSLTLLRTNTGRSAPASIAILRGAAPVTYTPKFAYVANNTASVVSAYSINGGTGELASLGDPVLSGTAGSAAKSVTADPWGRFVYVANQGAHNISAFSIDQSSGVLTVRATIASGIAPSGPSSVVVDPSGRFAYVANQTTNNVSAYRIDQVTGELTSVGATIAVGGTSGPSSVVVDPSGRYAFVANQTSDNVSSYTIDRITGVLSNTSVTLVALGDPSLVGPSSVVVDPTGRWAYVTNQTTNNVARYIITSLGGLITPSAIQAGTAPVSIGIDAGGKFAYVVNKISNDISAYSINQSNGVLTAIPCTGSTGCNVINNNFLTGTGPSSISIDPSGKFAYVVNESSATVTGSTTAFAINSNGSLSKIGATDIATGARPLGITTTGSIQ